MKFLRAILRFPRLTDVELTNLERRYEKITKLVKKNNLTNADHQQTQTFTAFFTIFKYHDLVFPDILLQ